MSIFSYSKRLVVSRRICMDVRLHNQIVAEEAISLVTSRMEELTSEIRDMRTRSLIKIALTCIYDRCTKLWDAVRAEMLRVKESRHNYLILI